MIFCTVTSPRPCGRPTTPLSKHCSQKETLLRSIWRDHQRQVHSSRLQLLPWWKISRQKIQTTSGKFPGAKDLVSLFDKNHKSWCPRINYWKARFKLTVIAVGVYSVKRCPFWFSLAGASSPMTKRLPTFSTKPWCATRSGTWGSWRTCGCGGRDMPSGSPTSPAWRGTKCSASRPGPTGEGQPGRPAAVLLSWVESPPSTCPELVIVVRALQKEHSAGLTDPGLKGRCEREMLQWIQNNWEVWNDQEGTY